MRSYLSVFIVLVQTCFGHPIYMSPRHGFTTIGSGFSSPDLRFRSPNSRLRFPEYGLRTPSPQSIFLGGGLRTYDTGFRPSDQGFNYLATRSRSPDVASLTIDRGSITHEQPYVGAGYNFQRESRRGTRADSVFWGRTGQRYNIGGTSYYERPMQTNYYNTFEQTSPMQTNNANPFQQVIPTTVRRDSHQITRGQRPRTQRQRRRRPGNSQQTTRRHIPRTQRRSSPGDSQQTTRRHIPRTQRRSSPGHSQQTTRRHIPRTQRRSSPGHSQQTTRRNIPRTQRQSSPGDSQQTTRRNIPRTQRQSSPGDSQQTTRRNIPRTQRQSSPGDSQHTTRRHIPRTQRQSSPGDSHQTINHGNTFDERFEQTSLMQTNHDTPFHQSRPTTVRRDSHQTTRRQRPRTQRQISPGDSQQTINHGNTFNGRLAQTSRLQTKHNNINEERLQQARPTSVRRDSQQATRRRMQRTQGERRRRPGHNRQDNQIIREGYIGAYGGENGFTYMGGYCPGEECNDGGLSVGLENGIGTGSLEEFNNRRRTGRNEDRTLYEMFATGPGTQAA